jgi:hypothetical protein
MEAIMKSINKKDIFINLNCYAKSSKNIVAKCIFEIISGMPSESTYPSLLNMSLTPDMLYIKNGYNNYTDSDCDNNFLSIEIPLTEIDSFEVVNTDSDKNIIIKKAKEVFEFVPLSPNSVDLAIKIKNYIDSINKL